MSNTPRKMILATTRFLLILISLSVITVPSLVLAKNIGHQNKVPPSDAATLTFLSSDMQPFGSLKDGKPVGFAVEILHEIMQRLGRTDTIEFDDWKVVYERTLLESYTALWPPSRTPEREELFKWVGPLIPEKIVLFARKDSGLVINSIEEAKKVSGIATVTGYASEKLLREKGFDNLVSQRSPIQGPDALKFGRADLWINSNITMKQTALDANVNPDLFEPVFIIKEIPSYLAFSKSVPDDVVNRWQTSLDDMKRDGSWEKIISKWVPRELLRIGAPPINFTEKERLWIETHPIVKVVQFFQEPPFTIDDADSHTGYLYDLLFETLRMAGLKTEFVGGFFSYDAMVEALHNGTVDILTTMENTRLLPDNIIRSIPVVKTPYALVAKISAPEIKHTSTLFGHKVAVVKGYAQDLHLDKFPLIKKVHVKNNEEGFEAVRMGRAEYFMNNRANAGYVLKKTFATDLRIAGTLSYVDFPPLALSFGIHGKDSALPGIINKALATMPIHILANFQDRWLAEEATIAASTPNRIRLTAEEQSFIAAHPVIRVHNEQNWAPFNFNENGTATGISIDYMNLLAKKIGLRIEYTSGPTWGEFLTMIKEHRLDVMLNIVKTDEREKFLNFTAKSYIETPRAIVIRKDDTTVQNFSDLYGRKVVVEKGFFYENYLKQNHPEIRVMTVKNTTETLRAVANGDAVATLGVIAVEQFLIDKHFFSNLKLILDPGAKALRSFDQYIGVRDDWPLLTAMLNKAMKAVTVKERIMLSQKWLDQQDSIAERIHLSPEEDSYLRDHPVLRVAFDVDWPPVEFFDKELSMSGMAADYLERIGELLGIEFEPSRPQSWKEMMKGVENGELDLFSSISPTPQRRKWLEFTDSYLSFPIVILTGKEVPYIASISDLKNKSVAVVDGYASHDILLENHQELTLLPVQDVKKGLLAVSTGKAFAFVGSLATMSHVMSREGLTDLKVSGETPYSFDITMGTRKDNIVLLKILNKALAAISPQERNAINNKWTSIIFEHTTDYSLLWRIIAGSLIILALVLYWNGRLKKEVAERKRAEKAAEAANRAKSRFLANMSHELRTPLNAILGFSELMSRDKNLPSEQLSNLETIGRSGEHLLSLINDVLELSKIEAGRIVLHLENFDLHRLLLDMEEMFRLRAQQKGLSLNFDRHSEVPQFIRADQSKLRQILINLLDNSVKFTETGRITLRVTCGKSSRKIQDNGMCSLNFEVIDTGVGILPEEQEKIFSAFFQGGDVHPSHQGTGLGLPICRKFVSMMGGDLEVRSETGKQTTFIFTIPVEFADKSIVEPSHLTRRVIELEAGQPVFRLLVVEDNDNDRNLLVKLLQSVGFEVQEATDGQEAIEIWERWQPHLIWMDLRMPVKDGYQATKEIKLSPKGKDTVIIALTANAFEKDRMKVIENGGNDFVRKPFREVEIFEMISKHLGVKFIYEAQNDDSATMLSENEMQNAFNLLPEDLCADFLTAVELVDFDKTMIITNRIRELDLTLADALTELLNSYRFDTLQRLIEKVT